MILIADCGSTKTDWCLTDGETALRNINTAGMNAVMLTSEEMADIIARELMPQLSDASKIEAVYFYGAGCLSAEVCGNVARAIASNIPSATTIEVYTDLLAAARALCGHKPGIACILGTGSNSCYYDGDKICDNVSPLGYILGDEGSGAVLGKLLVADVLKNQLPEPLCTKFLTQYGLDRISIIQRVYRQPQPNRFLASVSPFLLENISHPAIQKLVTGSFEAFFRRNVLQYAQARKLRVNFVGSIAWYYREILAQTAESCGLAIGNIVRSPMPGLIAFHKK